MAKDSKPTPEPRGKDIKIETPAKGTRDHENDPPPGTVTGKPKT